MSPMEITAAPMSPMEIATEPMSPLVHVAAAQPLEDSMDETLPQDQGPGQDVDLCLPEYQVVRNGSQKGRDLLVESSRYANFMPIDG